MTAVLGAFFVIFACGAFAMKKIAESNKAIENIRGLKQAFLHMAKKMEFESEPIASLMKKLSKEDCGDVAELFDKVSEKLTDGTNRELSQIWFEVVDEYAKKLNLSPKTIKIINNVGANLGKMAQNAEIEFLEAASDELEDEIKFAEAELSKNSKLLKSSGILAGIFIVIIFI
ncbi:MAG: stage III sporulation protein AB [Clostridia bacterium]|nr:stage III sporulation protein AB [Clostridia bacterium]